MMQEDKKCLRTMLIQQQEVGEAVQSRQWWWALVAVMMCEREETKMNVR
jgi:hypothetical protein